ncbi:MAG: hypothetical protein EOM55_02955 [Clostridia bacterium]|nr:hypothetical protein [Clostridia bacterium]
MKSTDAIKTIMDLGDKKVAVMVDKDGKLQIIDAIFQNVLNTFEFESYNENLENTNSLSFSLDDNNKKRLLLKLILTRNCQFGKNLSTNANTFAEFIMKNEPYKFIYGIFSPGKYDNESVGNLTPAKLDFKARKFYARNGFEIISLCNYLENPEKYPFISKKDFEDGDFLFKLVAKEIQNEKKDYGFKKINGIFVKDNVPENIKEEIDCMQM